MVVALGQLSSWNRFPNFKDSDGKIAGNRELLKVQMNATQLFRELGGRISHISIWGIGTK